MIVVANAGPLIALAQIGHFTLVTPLLDRLLAAGFRMSDELYQTARALAGEG